jgi:hypothetical protein
MDVNYFGLLRLAQAFGLGKGRFSDFQAERAIASLVASGDIEDVNAAWDALRTHEGPVWEQAVKASDEDSFLARAW